MAHSLNTASDLLTSRSNTPYTWYFDDYLPFSSEWHNSWIKLMHHYWEENKCVLIIYLAKAK